MEPQAFVDAVRTDRQTELSRLGSSKALYAATAGEMDEEAVFSATADAERTARDTFQAWAETADDSDVGSFFADVADEEDGHYRTVLELIDGGPDDPDKPDGDPDVSALHRYLRELDDSVPRLGAFVGRTLASDATKGQVVGFFVGGANPRVADTVRTFREDLDGQLSRALSLLAERCDSEADWERAHAHASEAIGTAYEEHVESLESMGVDPKPVC